MIANNVYGSGNSGETPNGMYPINEYGVPAGDVIVPEGVTQMGYTSSACNPFYYNGFVTSITFPSSLKAMAENCCRQSGNLVHVYNFENTSVSVISKYAFNNCRSLEEVSMPSTITSILDYAFSSCYKLTSINLPSSLATLSNAAFSGCNKLTTVTFESSTNLTTLGVAVFEDCTALTAINLPTSIKTLTSSLFRGCSALTSFTVADGITKIDNSAFRDCSGIKVLTLPSTLTYVNTQNGSSNMSFASCTGIETVNLADDFNCTISFSSSPAITNAAEMLTKLKDNTGSTAKTITFAKAVYDALTEEEIAVATNKNWTVASYGT